VLPPFVPAVPVALTFNWYVLAGVPPLRLRHLSCRPLTRRPEGLWCADRRHAAKPAETFRCQLADLWL
jgi:hypothetical protein